MACTGCTLAWSQATWIAHKARVIARAVEGCSHGVVEAIVGLWIRGSIETAPLARRRAQRLMEFPSVPVRQQVEEDRKQVGLRRWASSTAGVDEGVRPIPCEDAVTAWAAISQLAREYVRDGVRESLERAWQGADRSGHGSGDRDRDCAGDRPRRRAQ